MAIMKFFNRPIFQYATKSPMLISIPISSYPKIRFFSEIPASHLSNLISLSNIFLRYGFSPSQLPDFVKKNEFLQHSSPSEIEKSFKILSSLKPSQSVLLSTVSRCPRVLEIGFLEKWQQGILELGNYEMTSMGIMNVLEIARKFGLSPDDVFTCVKCLKSLGLSEGTVSRVLETVPMIIMSNEDEIHGKIEFLLGIGIQKREIDRVFGLFPRILAFGVENRLEPLLDEFQDLGFTLSEIRREILRDPLVLGFENGELSQCLEMLRSLKCRVAIKDNIFQNGEFKAGYKAKLRIDCLRKHGLIYKDAFRVLKKEPRIMLYETKDIEEKIDYLVHTMNFDIECLVEVPEYLGVNFDKQIVPRFKVIAYLRSKGGLEGEVSLRSVIKLSRLKFYNLYVKPYPECENIYGRFIGDVKVQNRHPVGMWKLFKPQQYPESREDIKNIKSYVKSLS